MTKACQFRIDSIKDYLRRLMESKKDSAYKVRPSRPTAKAIARYMRTALPGVRFTNVARDIRKVIEPGKWYDAEFDLLWRGQLLPEVIANYSKGYLAGLIKDVIAPCDMDARLAVLAQRRRPDGRPVWEEV